MILAVKESPMWIKTTLTSWLGTATGFSISLGQFEGEIRAWAALVGGILIPLTALAFHVYITLRKKK
jgi:ABC-type glycerol-3-phosphate transport system permease component|tara:strand:+ start:542 stop:742 length:201 start_codon:yes stop_codon:yes gene_type:complete